jgi:5-methylcytosine-specific restriction endonuclease McrA
VYVIPYMKEACMGRIRKFGHHRYWSAEDMALLASMYSEGRYSRSELGTAFPNRSVRTVESKAVSMGLQKRRNRRSPEEILAAKRAYQARKRAEDPDGCRQYANSIYKKNREQNKEKMRAYVRRRFFWSKAHRLSPALPAKALATLWKRQRGICALTGVRLDRTAHLDHIIPKARGGSDHISNLRWVSFSANMLKRDLLDTELFTIAQHVVNTLGNRLDPILRNPK